MKHSNYVSGHPWASVGIASLQAGSLPEDEQHDNMDDMTVMKDKEVFPHSIKLRSVPMGIHENSSVEITFVTLLY